MTLLKTIFTLLLTSVLFLNAEAKQQANLLIIHTDEHNFRTLGCYRNQLSNDQAFVWGEGVAVETPHLDRLAAEGAICNNYYAASPVCSPSRASFVSGTYPIATDTYRNDIPMNDKVITFAEVLKQEGYATSYIGKWHLDGDAKPGFEPERKFGFTDNRFMFNRGHWKGLTLIDGVPGLEGEYNPKTQNAKLSIKNTTAENFTTDYLTTRTLEILDRDKHKPFCIMLSIPDPHTPNTVRPPYDTMYNGMHFEKPKTMKVDPSQFPKWVQTTGKNSADALEQTKMQGYFGMVKCIDDNVGRLLAYLDNNDLTENTIVVFTSDHGDLMGEHRRHNKGLPYETSAKIPFILRYPAKVKSGKVINKAYTTVDFAPTILGLMKAKSIPNAEGLEASKDFTSKEPKLVDDRITYVTSSGSSWVAAVNNRYKLVLSIADEPWLFDLKTDPDEITNFYKNPEYTTIANKLQKELLAQLKQYNDPALTKGKKLKY